MLYQSIDQLVDYALDKKLIEPCEKIYSRNMLLALMGEDGYEATESPEKHELWEILGELCDIAAQRGIIFDSTENRDIFDARLMNCVMPRPSQVIRDFAENYGQSPEAATDRFYQFSGDTNYIRRDRIARDRKWTFASPYGELDITINLSKPEKDPRDIAAAGKSQSTSYPLCQLCLENEGYSGRIGHPGRSNHRVIPIELGGGDWFFQYSPYVYYNEHCIVFNSRHIPMKIDEGAFARLLDFVRQFPHYFLGSNADLPIVGGSILSHEHFQGGRYVFPMERAGIDREISFAGFEDVCAGIVNWPMSTIRLRSADPARLSELADRILTAWRGYTDASVCVFSETDGAPHNTITPIARRRGADFELDLVLRNNLTTEEHPLGVYHPHAELHHIKKENIGLIEVMGLAVLPGRLDRELAAVKDALLSGADMTADPLTASHAQWALDVKARHPELNADNADAIVKAEVGAVFETVLEHAGVFKRCEEGFAAFERFVKSV